MANQHTNQHGAAVLDGPEAILLFNAGLKLALHQRGLALHADLEGGRPNGHVDHLPLDAGGRERHADLDGIIDLDAERSRITKAIEAAAKERDALAGRLSNASFVEKAKPEAVEKARADHAEKAAEAERLTAALARLG